MKQIERIRREEHLMHMEKFAGSKRAKRVDNRRPEGKPEELRKRFKIINGGINAFYPWK